MADSHPDRDHAEDGSPHLCRRTDQDARAAESLLEGTGDSNAHICIQSCSLLGPSQCVFLAILGVGWGGRVYCCPEGRLSSQVWYIMCSGGAAAGDDGVGDNDVNLLMVVTVVKLVLEV